MNASAAAILTNPHPCGHIVYPYTDEALVGRAVALFASAGLRNGRRRHSGHDRGGSFVLQPNACWIGEHSVSLLCTYALNGRSDIPADLRALHSHTMTCQDAGSGT